MADWIVSVEGVTKRFGAVTAVDDVSLQVQGGEVFALLGPNGAGKSTLIRMLLGLQRPDSGHIAYRLEGTEGPPRPAHVGYLPEDRGLYPEIKVLPTLVYFGVLRGMERRAARTAAETWLERMGLADRGGEPLKSLSKGNQQKVQFISAVLHRPRFAVLDEPFSGLDPLNQDFFLGLIREMRDGGTTVLLSAHQMQLVERLADHVMVMNRGRPVLRGTLPEIRQRWTRETRLVLRVGGGGDGAALAAHPAVLRVDATAPGELTLYLQPDAPLNPVLAAAAQSLDVREVHSAPVTLHEAYVRAVGGETADADADAAQEVAA
ncbi:MAG TPA: ATP-binding cassette domain-containing protein [Longimicrobium sp.]|nr:ATP-binding cassette domain-containing protein [Longimicrobium sp.]